MIQTIRESSLGLIVGDKLTNLPVGKSYRALLMNFINVVDRNKSPF
ncbi:MAG: hypothetical protein MUO72_16420 [Bacteroidales bacterium]|nr:hypothetical protein [Bacteroidales bacterium]